MSARATAADLIPGAIFLLHDPRTPDADPSLVVLQGGFRYLDHGISVMGGTRPSLDMLEPCHVVRGRA